MIAPFPHVYEVDLAHSDDGSGLLSMPEAEITLRGGPPVQFGGTGGVWSPEELLLSAVALCLMTTFKALAKKNDLSIESYKTRCRGILNKTNEGIVFTQIELEVDLKTPNQGLGKVLMEKAKKYCIISNALKLKPTLVLNLL